MSFIGPLDPRSFKPGPLYLGHLVSDRCRAIPGPEVEVRLFLLPPRLVVGSASGTFEVSDDPLSVSVLLESMARLDVTARGPIRAGYSLQGPEADMRRRMALWRCIRPLRWL